MNAQRRCNLRMPKIELIRRTHFSKEQGSGAMAIPRIRKMETGHYRLRHCGPPMNLEQPV